LILQALLEMVLLPWVFLMDIVPTFTMNIPPGVGVLIRNIFLTVKAFVPWSTVVSIFTINFSITNWRIIWNVIQRVWDALPFT